MTDPNNPYGQQSGQPQQPGGQPQQPGQPYGQQPSYGQPGQAQPGQPQPGFDPNQPQFGAAPGASPFPNQPAQPSGFAKFMKSIGGRIVGVLLVVLIGVGVYFFQKSDAASASVGDCLNITGSGSDLESTQLDCSDATATYLVTETGTDATCDTNEVTFTESKGSSTRTKVCLGYNVVVGDCITAPGGVGQPESRVACSTKIGDENTLKVASIDKTTADESVCAEDTFPLTFPKRNTVICVLPNE